MEVPSTPVNSRQTEPHPRLAETVFKHHNHPWMKPLAGHSRVAFRSIAETVASWSGGLILDSGCGTGVSTAVLARRHPTHLVLGIDKSEVRLGKQAEPPPGNARLVRMDLEDFWLLAREAGWRFDRQCFYYPNPWPKPEQRLRRWPFHPVWPVALACGGVWELRTNWRVYALEFAEAFRLVTGVRAEVTRWTPPTPETLFERKYLTSGHSLWRWEGDSKAATGEPRPL